jgi:hypothetical protein
MHFVSVLRVAFLNEFGEDDPSDLSAVGEGGLGQRSHKSDVAAAVD